MDREWFGLKGVRFQGRRGARLDWRWKWRHRWTSRRFSDGCNETSPFNGKTPSHRALRFFIFTGRSFLCFIIVLNLFELQSFYVHQFRNSYVYVCVCRVEKIIHLFFFSILRTRLDFELTQEILRSKRWNKGIKSR